MWVFKVIRVFLPSSFSKGLFGIFFQLIFYRMDVIVTFTMVLQRRMIFLNKKKLWFLEFLCFFLQKKEMWGNKKKVKIFLWVEMKVNLLKMIFFKPISIKIWIFFSVFKGTNLHFQTTLQNKTKLKIFLWAEMNLMKGNLQKMIFFKLNPLNLNIF